MACKCQSIKPRKSSVELQPLILELLEIFLVYPVNQILKLVGVAGIQLLFRVGGVTGFRPQNVWNPGLTMQSTDFRSSSSDSNRPMKS